MKKTILLSVSALLSMMVSAQTVECMDSLKPEQKAMAVSLKLTGRLSASANGDYRQMRDLCFQVRTIDLGDAQSTEIPKNAFHSRHQLVNITLPKILKAISTQAFFACDKLQRITIPATVEHIGDAAFSRCKAVAELTIEGNPTIGEYAFSQLSGLKTVKVDAKVPPKAEVSSFYGIVPGSVQLIVPKGSEEAYRKATGWSRFYTAPAYAKEVSNPKQCIAPMPQEINVQMRAKALPVHTAWHIVLDGILTVETNGRDRPSVWQRHPSLPLSMI